MYRTVKAVAIAAVSLAAAMSRPPGPPESPGLIRFENRQAKSGVRFVLNNGTIPDKPIVDSVLGGVAVLDFDNDGFLDLYFSNGANLPGMVKQGDSFSNRLYRNKHDGTFEDVTARAGVAGAGYSMGVAVADYDNDGYADIFVAGVNRNILYHNNGDGTFADATGKAGLSGVDATGRKLWSVGAAWFDYDNDGLLDLVVSNYLDWSFEKNIVCGEPGKRLSCSPALYGGVPDSLYHNNGDRTFTDVSAVMGIGTHIGRGMGLAIADFNGDGYTDIFVANDNERNFLFRNEDGKRFSEVGVRSGVAYTEDGVTASSMGADFRDLNNDGYPDLVVTALAGETFTFRLNNGRGQFADATYQSGIGLASNVMSGWSVGAYDFDNDGFKDVFVTNSHASENADLYGFRRYRQHNAVFHNLRDGTFRNVTSESGMAAEPPRAHRGSAFGDLDNDGAIDVVTAAINDPVEILYNRSPRGGHWIIIEATGRKSNRDGIGTRMKLTGESGHIQYNQVTTSVGYVSSSDRRVYFGLGADVRVRELELRRPSGRIQVLRDLAVDRVLKVAEQ